MNTIKKQLLAGVLLAAVLAPAGAEAFCPSITCFLASVKNLLFQKFDCTLRQKLTAAVQASEAFDAKKANFQNIVLDDPTPRNVSRARHQVIKLFKTNCKNCLVCTNGACRNYKTVKDIKKLEAKSTAVRNARNNIKKCGNLFGYLKLLGIDHQNNIDIYKEAINTKE